MAADNHATFAAGDSRDHARHRRHPWIAGVRRLLLAGTMLAAVAALHSHTTTR